MNQLHEFTPEAFLRALPGLIRPTIQALLREHRVVLGHRFTEVEVEHQKTKYRGTFVVMALNDSAQCVVASWQWINGPITEHLETIEWRIEHIKGVVDGTVASMTREFQLQLATRS